MITQAIETIRSERQKLTDTFASVVVTLLGLQSSAGSTLKVNLDIEIPETLGGINWFDQRINAMLGLVNGITEIDPLGFIFVPKSLITALPTTLSNIEEQLADLLRGIEEVKSDGGIRDVDDDLVIHSVDQIIHPSVDLKVFYQKADNQIDQALKGVHDILLILNAERPRCGGGLRRCGRR